MKARQEVYIEVYIVIKKKIIPVICIALLLQCIVTVPSFAYFNRGTVSMQLGQTNVSIPEGKSVSVSVTVDPIKEQQLPGCGMAECPQSCGNTGCLNEYGECTCGGTAYQTYYSSVKAVSGNSSVASASYANGTLTIRGVAAGKTNITVTGSMRQYTDCSRTVSVTVTSSGSPGKAEQPAKGGTAAAGGDDPDGAVISDVKVSDEDELQGYGSDGSGDEGGAGEGGAEGAQPGEDSEILTTKRGTYEIVTLKTDTDVKAHLQAAADNQRFVTFQEKQGDNVNYSWTFDGRKIEAAEDIDLSLDISEELPENYRAKIGGANGLYLQFAHDGSLPAEAEMYVKVSSVFEDGRSLKLYLCSGDGATLEAEDIAVENGYVTFDVDHCSSYVLTDGELSEGGSPVPVPLIVLIAAAAVIIAAAVLLLIRRRKNAGKIFS